MPRPSSDSKGSYTGMYQKREVGLDGVRTNRYDIDRKHIGQNKDVIHRENVYMCIRKEVEDRAHTHCLGV